MLKTPFILFTNEETRTLKPLRAPCPKHGSYTNSDTFAITFKPYSGGGFEY